MQREWIQVRANQDTKRIAGAVAEHMDLSISAAIRVLVREKAEQLGITAPTLVDRRADQMEQAA
jgi:antitoxin component of RelBE/YafQ-DinJ toxin-antitoxin module